MVQSIFMVNMILQKCIFGYIIQRIFKTDPQKTGTYSRGHISMVNISKTNMYFYLQYPFYFNVSLISGLLHPVENYTHNVLLQLMNIYPFWQRKGND